MERIYMNNDWLFTPEFNEQILEKEYDESSMEKVRLPHTVKELPYHYFDEHEYQMVSGYRKVFTAKKEWNGKKILLTLEGVGHESQVYLNGELIKEHHCGYTAYTVDLSEHLSYNRKNVLVVKVDSRENINVPPFGFVIDYMTYGGIYRDVYLDIKEQSYIEDVFVKTKLKKESMTMVSEGEKEPIRMCSTSATVSEIKVCNPKEGMLIRQSYRRKGTKQYQILYTVDATEKEIIQQTGEVVLWDIDHPALYEMKTELILDEEVIDEKITTYGYRKAVFHKDGFYLNGRKVKIRGLNRHQSYAYVGYAMPESMQRLDADILKKELGLNAVRTSHYPQSHYFIDQCDALGLLVFTEIPGWQHIGDAAWKDQAVENVRDMVLQYRNHPSIILWGVRINESVDDDEFYKRTNAVAHELDDTRQTGGVRCYKKSNLFEDVYTYNDFVHSGSNKGCDKKSDVTSDNEKPYLISEYNGHMYPTKAFDWEEHRAEHAIRHANVLDAVAGEKDIAGSFGWCMFDYNTHKDFGSGDRICYHGVMDMFRNPKLAAMVYACQQEETPVLALSSSMDIGEHPGCNRGEMYIFTNADSVKMYKNDHFIKEYKREESSFKNLLHGPIKINDYIGDTLEKNEKMSHKQAEDVKALLNEVAKVGLYNLSKPMYLKAGKLMLLYHMKMTDAVELYNRYVGDWGGESTIYRFEAIKDGEVVKTITKQPMRTMNLSVTTDHNEMVEKNTYDVAAIRITAVDEEGNLLPFSNDPLSIKVEGAGELIGPNIISLNGGMLGAYIKTIGKEGEIKVTITSTQSKEVVLNYTVTIEK